MMLFPAGVLILVVLAALSFDVSLLFQAKRSLVDRAASAANDAATVGVDLARLHTDGAVCLDLDRARRAVEADLAAETTGGEPDGEGVTLEAVELLAAPGRPDCATTVVVRLGRRVAAPFGRAIPGAPREHELHTAMRATVVTR